MVFKASVMFFSSSINIFKYATVSFPFKTDWDASFLPNLISVPSKYICFDSILILLFEDKPTEFSPLIKILSDFAFNVILSELRIIWGLIYWEGRVGGVV